MLAIFLYWPLAHSVQVPATAPPQPAWNSPAAQWKSHGRQDELPTTV
jgi:hypothetical protein